MAEYCCQAKLCQMATATRAQVDIREAKAEMKIVLPGKIVFGAGVFSQLGALSAGLGESALLCVGKSSARSSGCLDQAVQLLRARGIGTELFEGVENDPSLHTCEQAIARAREAGCDFVIAIGGGSVLDAGKTVAALAPQPGRLEEYFHAGRILEHTPLPFIAVPTTAGTGTECTINAVLTDTERGVKKSLRNERMAPTVALVDPKLTVTCPPDITAQAGMDALTQAVECYVSSKANTFSDALALRAVELIAANLPGAVADGSDLYRRQAVAEGSLIAGMAFGNAGLGAVHGLAHPLGAQLHIPHGLICAVLLPHVCAFNLSAREEKFTDIAELLNARSAAEAPAALAVLNCDVGIPPNLRKYDLQESNLPMILANCRSGSMANNPKHASDGDLRTILRRVF